MVGISRVRNEIFNTSTGVLRGRAAAGFDAFSAVPGVFQGFPRKTPNEPPCRFRARRTDAFNKSETQPRLQVHTDYKTKTETSGVREKGVFPYFGNTCGASMQPYLVLNDKKREQH